MRNYFYKQWDPEVALRRYRQFADGKGRRYAIAALRRLLPLVRLRCEAAYSGSKSALADEVMSNAVTELWTAIESLHIPHDIEGGKHYESYCSRAIDRAMYRHKRQLDRGEKSLGYYEDRLSWLRPSVTDVGEVDLKIFLFEELPRIVIRQVLSKQRPGIENSRAVEYVVRRLMDNQEPRPAWLKTHYQVCRPKLYIDWCVVQVRIALDAVRQRYPESVYGNYLPKIANEQAYRDGVEQGVVATS